MFVLYLYLLTIDCLCCKKLTSVLFKHNIWQMFSIQNTVLLLLVVASMSSEIQGQESLAVTIYNDDFAMVKDVRRISFDAGESILYFTDVADNIQTKTVTFKAIQNPGSVRVYEQNFERNLVNTDGILDKYINQEVTVFVDMVDTTRRVSGKLLGFKSGIVVETKFGVEIFNSIIGVELPALPDGFFTTPTLHWNVWSSKVQTTNCQVAYRTRGFGWSADYSLTLNQNETSADIGGWVTIDNNSGKYVNAKLKLIAGEVNTVQQNNNFFDDRRTFAQAPFTDLSFSEKSFADYHLYTLSRPVTLNDASQKQVEFIPKVYGIPLRKYHEIRINSGGYSEQNLDARNYINFINSQKNGLGIPFPKGIVRVFKEDEDDGSLEFIGEDRIDHTPKDQNITLTTGNAFDIVADKISESRTSTSDDGSYNAKLRLKVTNHKDTAAEVVIKYSNGYGDNLRLIWKNQAALVKLNSGEYEWRKVLKADEVWETTWEEDYRYK